MAVTDKSLGFIERGEVMGGPSLSTEVLRLPEWRSESLESNSVSSIQEETET